MASCPWPAPGSQLCSGQTVSKSAPPCCIQIHRNFGLGDVGVDRLGRRVCCSAAACGVSIWYPRHRDAAICAGIRRDGLCSCAVIGTTLYSVSFVFGQLRYRARSLRSSGKAAADACRSPKTAGSCAKCCAIAQARHRCGRFRGYHAPRLSAALPDWRASAALGSRFLRERPANHARYLN